MEGRTLLGANGAWDALLAANGASDALLGANGASDALPGMDGASGTLLAANGASASGTLLLPPAEAAAAIEAALHGAQTPRQLPQSTLAEPRRLQRWAYALAPIVVAALGILYVVAWSADDTGGKLVVTTTPPVPAELVVDGRSAGQLPPFVRTIPTGKHRLEVRAKGYRSFSAEVDVSAGGRPVEVTRRFRRPPAPPTRLRSDYFVLSGATGRTKRSSPPFTKP